MEILDDFVNDDGDTVIDWRVGDCRRRLVVWGRKNAGREGVAVLWDSSRSADDPSVWVTDRRVIESRDILRLYIHIEFPSVMRFPE